MEFGARGDAVHDDTAALQWALRREPYPYFPEGQYLVDGSLTTSMTGQILRGASMGAMIRLDLATYDLTKQHAALTLNGRGQTVHNLAFAGPDAVYGLLQESATHLYNLSALRINGSRATVNDAYVANCEGVGVTIAGEGCTLWMVHIDTVGLDGVRAAAGAHLSRMTFGKVGRPLNMATYPPNATSGANLNGGAFVLDCTFFDHGGGLTVRGQDHIISGSRIESGLHVAANNVTVSDNIIRTGSGNAITVANDGQSSISSLRGNIVGAMDQGGPDDITDPSLYSEHPVKSASGNRNPKIRRVYEQKAYAQIRLKDRGTSDGHVPLKSLDHGQLVDVDTKNDTFTFARYATVEMTLSRVIANTAFKKGEFQAINENTGSTVHRSGAITVKDSTNSPSYVLPARFQASFHAGIPHRLYIFSDQSGSVADVEYDRSMITITDVT
jgi:hypothetical protein